MSSELHYMAQAGTVASESLAKAADVLAAKRQNRTNDYFATAHGNTSSYSSADYTRVAFKTKADAERFIADMASQRISAVAMPVKVEGQYLAELPKTMDDGRSAAAVLQEFSARSYVEYSSPRVDQPERNREYRSTGLVDEFLMSNEVGQLIHTISQVSDTLGAGKYGEHSNKDVFNTPLYHDGTANPIVDTGRAKTATVINDHIVMMDGKVVHDEALRNYVLAQHEERLNKAESYSQRAESRNLYATTNYVNQQAAKFETLYDKHLNGEKLSPHQMKELNKAYDVIGGLSHDLGRTIDKDHPLTSDELRAYNDALLAGNNINKYDINAWRNASTSSLGITDSTRTLLSRVNDSNNHNLKVRETNAAYILNHTDRQEYAVSKSFKGIDTLKPTTSVLARWDMGALNKITDQINTSLTAAYELVNTQMVYEMDQKDLDKLADGLDFSKDAKPTIAQIVDNIDKGWAENLAKQKLNGAGDVTKGLYISVTERNRIIEIMHKKNLSYADLLTEKGAKEVASLFDEKSRARIEKALTTITDEDKKFISNMKKVFAEPQKLLQNNKLLADLRKASWAKGIGVSGSVSAMDLATMNSNFLNEAASKGVNFVTLSGKFNVKKLQKLSSAEMAKLGLTESTRNMLVQLNAKGAFGSIGVLGVAGRGIKFGRKGINLIRKMDDHGEGWQDISQLTSAISNMKQGGEAAINGLHAAKSYASAKIDLWRTRHPKKPINQNNVRNVKPRTNRKKELSEAAQKRVEERTAKLASKTEEKIAKTASKQNTFGKRMQGAIDRVKARIAKTKVAKALDFLNGIKKKVTDFVVKKLIYPVAGFVMKGVFFTYIVIVVSVLVIALVDMIAGLFDISNWLAPKTYEDTVAYTLYSQLKDEETKYLTEMGVMDKEAAKNLDTIKFGFLGQDTKQYVDGTDHVDENGVDNITNLYYDEASKKMYINPFWRDNTVDPTNKEDREKYCTLVEEFDGTHQYTITTNLNYYNITSDISHPQDIQYGISNGHTSNIKDIICMTDVMYQMQASDCDADEDGNGGLQSILSKSPEQLDWDTRVEEIGRGFAVVGEFFVNLWNLMTGNPTWDYPTLTTPTKNVSYNTVWAYARTLFMLSHQQYVYLDVTYGDANKKIVDDNGNEYAVHKDTALYFGITNGKLTEKEFGVARHDPEDPESIAPVIGDKFLDEGYFDVDVTMENLKEGEEAHICLWEDMPTADNTVNLGAGFGILNYATTSSEIWDRISKVTCTFHGGDNCGKCWHPSNPSSYKHDTVYVEGDRVLAGAYTVVDVTVGGSHTHSESGTKPPDTSAIIAELTNELQGKYNALEPNRKIDTYVIHENDATFYDFTVYDFSAEIENNSPTPTVQTQTITIPDPPGGGGSVVTTIWRIELHGKAKVYDLTEYYKYRKCNCLHKFVYDGGHISTHTIGNVFSITNEQLAMTGIFDDGDEPIALFDTSGKPYSSSLTSKKDDYLFEKNYSQIIGRVNRNEVNYTSASNAQTTGGGPTISENIYQGSAVSKGLNVNADGENWASVSTIMGAGTEVGSGNYVRLCRDLFDVDCIFLKGALLFPFKNLQDYEGWTADNMQLACNRMCMDWYEVYGFDISQEIGDCDYALSEIDIEMLIVGMKVEYGDKFTENRERAVRAMLMKVGRGHYFNYDIGTNEDGTPIHAHQHGFLSMTEKAKTSYDVRSKLPDGSVITDKNATSVAFEASCSCGTSLDFIEYARNYVYKETDTYTSTNIKEPIAIVDSGLTKWTNDAENPDSRILPADVIYHAPYLDGEQEDGNYLLPNDSVNSHTGSGLLPTTTGEDNIFNGKTLLENHLSEQAVIFMGWFHIEAWNAMKEYLKGELDEETYKVAVGEERYTPLNGYRYTDLDGKTIVPQKPLESIMLTNGTYLTLGQSVVIDLSQMGFYSGIYLKCEGLKYSDLYKCVGDLQSSLDADPYETTGLVNPQWYYTSPFNNVSSSLNEAKRSKQALRICYYWVNFAASDDRVTFVSLGYLYG